MLLTALLASLLCPTPEREVVLFPFQVQVNGAFTQHYGLGLGVMWHADRAFGFKVFGFYNYASQQSAFAAEMIEKTQTKQTPDQLQLHVWGLLFGFELAPVIGQSNFYSTGLARLSIGADVSVGLGGTRHQLQPSIDGRGASYGDTGVHLLGAVGVAVRLKITDHFWLRLELRDILTGAAVDSVNGCNRADLDELNRRILLNVRDPKPVRDECRVDSWDGPNPETGLHRANDLPLALNLTQASSVGLVQHVVLSLGASFLF